MTGADNGQSEQFWNEIWSNQKRCNDGEWMAKLENSPEQFQTKNNENRRTREANKMSKWKPPRSDQVQGLWIKHLTVHHERISNQLQDLLRYLE